jgi:uncharacterized iron-regulated membrane protein
MSLRRLWLQAHRWLALTLGLPLAFVALLGAALTVAKPLDRWAHPELFRAAPDAPSGEQTLESTRQSLLSQLGRGTTLTFRPPREAGDTLWVSVRGPWNGTVYIDPASGRELGRRGEHEGMYNLLFELHSSLLLEDTGKALLTILALVYLVMLASGLVLWWPRRWDTAWRVELKRGPRRAVFDLHRVGGSLLGMLVAVSVASGAYMAWRPLSRAVTALTGTPSIQPPSVPAGEIVERMPLDAAVQRAQALFPGSVVGYVQLPAQANKPLRVRLKLPDDPHPNGLSSVWLHPASGQALAVHRWNELDAGARAYTVVYPLHTGELGGQPHVVLNALLGLLTAGFAGTGLWLWWKRRS